MLVQGWTLLAFTCLLIAICLADTSASRLEAMKSQELEAPNKADRVTELIKEEESEGLETRYDRFGRVFKIPFGRVNRDLKSSAAEAQVESGSKEKNDGNKKSSSPKPMKIAHEESQASKDQTKDGDMKKPVISTDGKGTRKSNATTPMPKPKNERKTVKTSSTPNKNPHGGSRVSKIEDKRDERKNASKKNEEGSNHETATRKPPMPLNVGREGGPSPLGPGTRKSSVPNEPSPIAPDTSFASGNVRSSSDSSPSTATAAPKEGKKGKKVQEGWSVWRLLIRLLVHLFSVAVCAYIYFKWYHIPSPSKRKKTTRSSKIIRSAVVRTNYLNAPHAGNGSNENRDKNSNELIPPLDESLARKRKEKILDCQNRLNKLRAHVKMVEAEHKSDTRTAKFRKMGPIYIPREPPIPPAADLPDNIVLEKVTYDPENNEIWDIGSDIDDIELDESFHIESYLSETEDEDDGGSKKSKKSNNVGSNSTNSTNKKKKTEGNDDTNTAKEPKPAAPLLSPAAPIISTPSHPTDSTSTNHAHITAPLSTNPAESAALAPMVPPPSSNVAASTAIPTLLPATTGTPN